MTDQIEKYQKILDAPWLGGNAAKVGGLLTSAEALKAGGLDWDVELKPVTVNGTIQPDYKAIVRVPDQQVYAIVGNRYVPIQNKANFKFFDAVVGGGFAIYDTVGSVDGGRKIWILADLKGSIGVLGDEIKKYVVLSSSHDGSLARQMFLTPIRVVCKNTLQAAIATAMQKFYTRHTANADAKVEAAREILGLANGFYVDFQAQMERLAMKQLPKTDLPLLLGAAFGVDSTVPMDAVYNPIKIQMQKVEELIEVDRPEFAPALHGTVYEAYNAVVKFTDYYRHYRGNTGEARLNGVWFGGGNVIKARTLAWATGYSK
jgi:phage/plasmid-like protein (TIGR03299 family)